MTDGKPKRPFPGQLPSLPDFDPEEADGLLDVLTALEEPAPTDRSKPASASGDDAPGRAQVEPPRRVAAEPGKGSKSTAVGLGGPTTKAKPPLPKKPRLPLPGAAKQGAGAGDIRPPRSRSSPTASKPDAASSPTASSPTASSPTASKPEAASSPTASSPEAASSPTASKPEAAEPSLAPPPESLFAPPPPPPRDEDIGFVLAHFDPAARGSSDAAQVDAHDPPADAVDPREEPVADLDIEELGADGETDEAEPPPLPPAADEPPAPEGEPDSPASDRPTPVGAIVWDGTEAVEADEALDDAFDELELEPTSARAEQAPVSEPPPLPGARNAFDLDPTVLDDEQAGGVDAAPPESARSLDEEPGAAADAPDVAIESAEIDVESLGLDPFEASEDDVGGALPAERRPEETALTPPDPENELPAAAALARRDGAARWHARAERLEALANAQTDAATKGRQLLLASELWAIVGDVERARATARKATQAAPTSPMAKRQARVLAAQEGDWQVAGAQLDGEARAARTPEGRAHAAIVSSEIRRLLLDDADNARRRQDLAQRAWPADPRPAVLRLAEELGAGAAPPKTTVPDAAELSTLAAAVHALTELRGGAPAGAASPSPTTALLATQRHLSERRPAQAVDALRSLAELPSLREAALWLMAAVAAPSAETRPGAVEALQSLLALGPAPRVRRVLAMRALELGDREALQSALDSGTDDDGPFSPADRLALHALSGLAPPAELAGVDHPIAIAALRARDPSAALPAGSEPQRAREAVGRRLGSAASVEALSEALAALSAASPDDPLVAAFELERQRAAGHLAAVASGLLSWPGAEEDPAARMASAILATRGGDAEHAAARFLTLLSTPELAEVAARALSGQAAEHAVEALKHAAAAAESDEQRAVLLYEAALRRAAEAPQDAIALVDEAASACPSLPVSYTLGDRLSRLLGDSERLREWLGRRRDASDDPTEQALDAVREALLVADSDPARARSLLSAAVEARPEDIALHELHERLSPDASEGRGRWREAVAKELADAAASSGLLIEAAFELERAGDLRAAARAAGEAAERQGGAFARLTAERLARDGPQAVELSRKLLERAEAAEDPAERRALYEQLHQLDLARGGAGTALMWHQTILEITPGYLPSLRALAHAYLGDGRDEELEPIATAIAQRVGAIESGAHALLAARIRSRTRPPLDRLDLVELTLERSPETLWALRDHATLAELSNDPRAIRTAYERLAARGGRPMDIAAFHLRASEAAMAQDDPEGALGLLDQALEAAPDYTMARAARAAVRERLERYQDAAEDLEAAAAGLGAPAVVAALMKRAGTLWLEQLDDLGRAMTALEAAAQNAPGDEELFDRLQLAYVRAGERSRLAELLQRRIETTTDPEQRLALEINRSQALADVGDRKAARQALDAALEANPDHVDALEVYAKLCAADGDHRAAEQAYIRLARAQTSPEAQAEVYRNLGHIYFEHIKNPQRAERCYREVLRHHPNDELAAERLVSVYVELGKADAAIDLQSQLIERSGSVETKRDRTLTLAEIHDRVGDKKSALGVLEAARKNWPNDDRALRAQVTLHQKHGETAAAKILLDRAANEARRALGGGRFDSAFFATLATVAELRGGAETAATARSTLAALEGRDEGVPGGGAAAGDPRLDDLIAPEALSPALRSLVKKLAGLLDAAYPVDLRALQAAPPPAQASDFVGQVRGVAAKLGIQGLEVLVSPTLNATWLPASATPPRLVVGQALLDSRDQAVQKFALFRSLKVLQSQGAALTRMSPVDLWPVVAALLSTFAKSWHPQGIDAAKLAEATRLIEAARLPRVDDDVPTLALEVAGSIGNRAPQLGAAYLELGNRAALLATGSPAAALRALGLAVGSDLPETGPDRLKWIVRNAEARDLAVFSVSDACAEARQKLGLTQ